MGAKAAIGAKTFSPIDQDDSPPIWQFGQCEVCHRLQLYADGIIFRNAGVGGFKVWKVKIPEIKPYFLLPFNPMVTINVAAYCALPELFADDSLDCSLTFEHAILPTLPEGEGNDDCEAVCAYIEECRAGCGIDFTCKELCELNTKYVCVGQCEPPDKESECEAVCAYIAECRAGCGTDFICKDLCELNTTYDCVGYCEPPDTESECEAICANLKVCQDGCGSNFVCKDLCELDTRYQCVGHC